MKNLILLALLQLSAFASGLVLKPLNPYPVADDTFDVTIDFRQDLNVPEWVKLAGPMREYRFVDSESPFRLAPTHRAEIRLFQVDKKASFQDVVREIGKLHALGFRPTTLRHLFALVNGPNLKLLDPGVAVIASDPPVTRMGLVEAEFMGALFVASILKDQKIEIGLIGEPSLKTFKVCIVILEAPPQ